MALARQQRHPLQLFVALSWYDPAHMEGRIDPPNPLIPSEVPHIQERFRCPVLLRRSASTLPALRYALQTTDLRFQACLNGASDASAAGRLCLDHVPDVGALLGFEHLPGTECGRHRTDADENGEQRWRARLCVRSSTQANARMPMPMQIKPNVVCKAIWMYGPQRCKSAVLVA